jgi:hypothetical protein
MLEHCTSIKPGDAWAMLKHAGDRCLSNAWSYGRNDGRKHGRSHSDKEIRRAIRDCPGVECFSGAHEAPVLRPFFAPVFGARFRALFTTSRYLPLKRATNPRAPSDPLHPHRTARARSLPRCGPLVGIPAGWAASEGAGGGVIPVAAPPPDRPPSVFFVRASFRPGVQ